MVNLGNPRNAADILKKYNFDFKKKFGQNFLVDANVLDNIVSAAEIESDDFVLEIGPGMGSMTQVLCERAKKVIAVEIDKKLIPVLEETLAAYDNVRVINEDILKTDINEFVRENDGKPIKIVANLPYYITTPLIMQLLESKSMLKSITVMVQSEVAERMQASPGSKDYGALSLAVQFYANPKVVMRVSPECFMPKPNVESSVIRLECFEESPLKVVDEKLMFKLIRASFNQRRKTLANGIKNASFLDYSREDVLKALEKMDLSETVRGEALSLRQFAELSDLLSK